MSTYAKIFGELRFDSKEKYNQAKSILQNGGWISGGQWVDEAGDNQDLFDETPLKIEIPLNYYRNLINVLDDIVLFSGYFDIIWASTDGMFSGGIISSGGNTLVHLEKWAESNEMDKPIGPKDSEEYVSWKDDVVDAFMEDPGNI